MNKKKISWSSLFYSFVFSGLLCLMALSNNMARGASSTPANAALNSIASLNHWAHPGHAVRTGGQARRFGNCQRP